MFGQREPRRTYRVYAEDDFFGEAEQGLGGIEEAGVDGGGPRGGPSGGGGPGGGGAQDGGAAPYTAPRRTLPGPLEGRFGVVPLALAAMAISALVVHLLRASLDGGEAAPRPSLVGSGPPASGPTVEHFASAAGGRKQSGVTARAAAQASSDVAPNVSPPPSGVAHNFAPRLGARAPRRDRLGGLAPGMTPAETNDPSKALDRGRASAPFASPEVGAGAPTTAVPGPVDDATPASELPAAPPEFGFERYER